MKMIASLLSWLKGTKAKSSSQDFEFFEEIYNDKGWGDGEGEGYRYYSGAGSHDPLAVLPYVSAVRAKLSNYQKMDVVDLGCGDFAVGSQIVDVTRSYKACDVVAPLITHNSLQYAHVANLQFNVVNIVKDRLPSGDLVFLRQVLQHLGNDEIKCVLDKVSKNYRYLIFTDHLPAGVGFTPNMDMLSGGDIRLNVSNSGLDLAKEPFKLAYKSRQVLCEVPYEGREGIPGLIRTTFFEL